MGFSIIAKISSSLMFREEIVLSVLSRSIGKLLEFCNRVHCDAKYLLKIAAFREKFEIIYPSTSRDDNGRNVFVTKKTI